jgi:enolase-phosphatase E1
MPSTYKLHLLDVEGTVAPLTLTTEILFPYARAHFGGFLREHLIDPAVLSDLHALVTERGEESDSDAPRYRDDSQDPLPYLFWLMDRDRKSTALKSLQGKIWKAGFESGQLKGILFPDVPEAFARWSAQGRVAIYSSGSVEAQQLLFRYSSFGDLTSLLSGHFDTHSGPKNRSASYASIAATMRVDSSEGIFFSDVVRELDAAREAGFSTRLVVREGNAPIEDFHDHLSIASLTEAI